MHFPSTSGGGALSAIPAYSILGNNTASSAVPSTEQYPVLGSPGYVAATGTGALQITGTVANYWQVTLQNKSNNANASTDLVVTADDGDDSTHFADFGINGSAGGGAPFTAAHEAYLYTTDNKLSLGALGATGTIGFYTGATPTLAGTVDVNQQWTFSGNGAASVSSVLFNGTAFTGGSGTTTFPKLFIQPTGTTAATTWSTSGTQIGVNAVSGFAGNFLDFRINGGSTVFTLSSAGAVNCGIIQCSTLTSTNRFTTSFNGGASLPVITATGTLFTGGTGTTTFPQYFAQSGAATGATTWSTAGTYLGVNADSGFTGSVIDYHRNGGSSLFRIDSSGSVFASGSTTTVTVFASQQIGSTWTAQASNSVITTSAAPFSGGTGTTTFPQWFSNGAGATAATNWSTSGTVFGANIHTSVGNFVDYKIDGTSQFTVSGTGSVVAAGTVTATSLIEPAATTPASAAAAGVMGTIVWDTGFIYVCTATNTWKRVAIATW